MKQNQTKEKVKERLLNQGKEALELCLYYEETHPIKQRSAMVFYTVPCTDGILYFWENEREQSFGVIEGDLNEFKCMVQTLEDRIHDLEKEKQQLENILKYVSEK